MNILLVTNSFYPSQIGGPANTLYWHAKALNDKGFNVTVITTTLGIKERHNIKADQWLTSENYKIIYCKSRLRAVYEAYKCYNKFDVIHLSSIFFYPSIAVGFFCFLSNKNVFWSPRGECSSMALIYSVWKKKPVLQFLKIISKKTLFHATSSKETEEIKKVFSFAKIIEIPNYLYLEKVYKEKVKRQLLFVGRVHPIKALENLFIATTLSAEFLANHFTLQIVGSAPFQEDYLEKLKEFVKELKMEDRIQFLGHIDGVEKDIKYAESYCLMLPSHTENFGNVVIESLNQGTPVIASKNTPWEILEKYGAGMHVSNQPDELAKAINKIISLSDGCYELTRANAYKLCKEQFSIEDNIKKWTDVYSISNH